MEDNTTQYKEDHKKVEDKDKDNNNNMENNDDEGISDMGLDRDLRFSHRYQGLQ